MKIIIFGSTGMLGNYVNLYLSSFYEIVCIKRELFDIETTDWNKLYDILLLYTKKDDIIINCSGAIPQQNSNIRKYIILNTLFPYKLNEFSIKLSLKFIHITTDCVFSGVRGGYNESDIHDSDNIYGISKSLGDNIRCSIIRTSIIGEELFNKNNLIEWLKKNKNSTIDGYNNVLWNGITCFQLSKIINYIITNNIYWNGVRHFFSPNIVSKYELCCLINEEYNLNITINKNNIINKNMTLTTIYDNIIKIPDIKIQIKEQHNFTNNSSGLYNSSFSTI
jgi:dTDP-4-dehydrorhamnose reductase